MPKKKILNFFIKILIAALLVWAIYEQVFARQDANSLYQALVQHFTYPNLFWLVTALVLVPLNIVLESLKWRELIKGFSELSLWQSTKAILAGISIAIFTPNRVGEYGGRILFIPPEDNWKAVIATLVGSLAQLLAILSFGLISLLYFSRHYLPLDWQTLSLILSLGFAVVGLMIFSFFNIDLFVPIVKRLPFIRHFKKYFKHLLVLKKYTRPELTKALVYATLRYLTYSLQYFLLLKFFGIPVSLLSGLAGVATIFFIQASIPLPPVMGLLARGEIALQVWGIFSNEQVNILASTFLLFVINIAAPALIGLVFIIQTNILRSLGYENES